MFGIEGDGSWTSVNKYNFLDVINNDEILRTKFDWYASVRGRLGLAFDRVLVYGTGGVAFSGVRNTYENYTNATLTVLNGPIHSATNDVGWLGGGGIEYAFTYNWIARVEGLYYDFGKKSLGVSPNTLDARTSFAVARFGLSYKFGGPVVARY